MPSDPSSEQASGGRGGENAAALVSARQEVPRVYVQGARPTRSGEISAEIKQLPRCGLVVGGHRHSSRHRWLLTGECMDPSRELTARAAGLVHGLGEIAHGNAVGPSIYYLCK